MLGLYLTLIVRTSLRLLLGNTEQHSPNLYSLHKNQVDELVSVELCPRIMFFALGLVSVD